MTHSSNGLTPRFLALWFPYLPAERVMRRRFGRSWRSQAATIPSQAPIVFSRRESNTLRVTALDARAETLNLRIGLGVAEARAMHPGIEIIEEEPLADRRLLESLADWCDRYTPLVALEDDSGLFLNISGCAHLFDGERAMLDEIVSRFRAQGFDARAGLASTPGAAWAAARYTPGHIVGAGAEAAFFAPLPLGSLRLDAPTSAGLESVGLRVAGALMKTPRAPLVRRFGSLVTLRLDQALGHLDEPVSPRLPAPALSVERRFFEPVTERDDIETILNGLVERLKPELERRVEGARQLQLQLFRIDGEVSRVTVAASRPLRDSKRIIRLFHEKLSAASANIDPGYGFDLIRLAVLEAEALPPQQASLGDSDETQADLAQFADRVCARLGEQTLTMPRLSQTHIPELAATPAPFFPDVRATCNSVAATERPVRLLERPEQIEVVAVEIPEGPPSRFRWRHVSYRVARAEGPERIAPEWWRSSAIAGTRDYFRVEDDDGRRYWLYREGSYGGSTSPPGWFVQGLFA